MGLWLVRWYDLRASLIEARDEADLLRAIDEVDSPKSCTWEPYRGPVYLPHELEGLAWRSQRNAQPLP